MSKFFRLIYGLCWVGAIGCSDKTAIDDSLPSTTPEKKVQNFTFVQSNPVDDFTDFARRGVLSITFSQEVDEKSATREVIQILEEGKAAVDAAISVNGRELVIRPKNVLKPLTRYSYRVSDGLISRDGLHLVGAVAIDVRTSDRTLGDSETLVGKYDVDGLLLELAMNQNGEAVAIWMESGAGNENLDREAWMSRFSPVSGWTATQQLEAQRPGLNMQDVGIDDSGNVIANWKPNKGVWVTRFEAGKSTGTSQEVAAGDYTKIAVNGPGEALVVADIISDSLVAVHFDPTTKTWTQPLEIAQTGVQNYRVALNDKGEAIVAWSDEGAIWVNHYTQNQWARASRVADAEGFVDLELALREDGQAALSWSMLRSSVWSYNTAGYIPEKGWQVDQPATRPYSAPLLLRWPSKSAPAHQLPIEGTQVRASAVVNRDGIITDLVQLGDGYNVRRFVPALGWLPMQRYTKWESNGWALRVLATDALGRVIAVRSEARGDNHHYEIVANYIN